MSLNCVVQIGPALAIVGALSSSLWSFDKLLSTPVPGCLITFYFLALQDALFLSCHPHSWLFLVLFSILFSPEINKCFNCQSTKPAQPSPVGDPGTAHVSSWLSRHVFS